MFDVDIRVERALSSRPRVTYSTCRVSICLCCRYSTLLKYPTVLPWRRSLSMSLCLLRSVFCSVSSFCFTILVSCLVCLFICLCDFLRVQKQKQKNTRNQEIPGPTTADQLHAAALSVRVVYQSAGTVPWCIPLVFPLTRSSKQCHVGIKANSSVKEYEPKASFSLQQTTNYSRNGSASLIIFVLAVFVSRFVFVMFVPSVLFHFVWWVMRV